MLEDLATKIVQFLFLNLAQQLLDFTTDIVGNILNGAIDVLEIPIIQDGIAYTQGISVVLVLVRYAWALYEQYFLYTDGDPDVDPKQTLFYFFRSLFVIGALPKILKEVFLIGSYLVEDIGNKQYFPNAYDINNLDLGSSQLISPLFSGKVVISFIIVLAVSIIFIFIFIIAIAIQTSIRAAELGVYSVAAPIFGTNLVKPNSQLWNNYFKRILVVCCSQGFQLFMFMVFIYMIFISAFTSWGLLKVIGWGVVSVRTPAIIKEVIYSSGVSSASRGAAKQGASYYLMRKTMTRG